ncbi:MAG: peptide deformylase [Bdellovibrionales bacterium]|nr:peptide deformylase [Bdellovibrionales bacterium]
MSKLKIYAFPDVVLTKKAAPIARVEKSYFKLADDMFETMYDAPGIGLAANQVGILERILVLDVDYDYEELEGEFPKPGEVPKNAEVFGRSIVTNRKPIIIINPEIIRKEGKIKTSEGCLSVPEYTAEVERAKKITLQYQNIDGLTKTLDAEELLAVAIQHEMDHLEGRLFIDRLSPLKKEMAQKKLRKERAERESFGHDLMNPRDAKKRGF